MTSTFSIASAGSCCNASGLRPDKADGFGLSAKELAKKGGPIAGLIALVLGGMYAGFFTPVEAGAVGAFGALMIGFARRSLSLSALWRVLVETGQVTASVCFLIIAAQMYSRMLAFSGVPMGFAGMAVDADLGLMALLTVYVLCVIAMGMILDSSSIMLIVVPLMLPVIAPLQVDLIWFGIVTAHSDGSAQGFR